MKRWLGGAGAVWLLARSASRRRNTGRNASSHTTTPTHLPTTTRTTHTRTHTWLMTIHGTCVTLRSPPPRQMPGLGVVQRAAGNRVGRPHAWERTVLDRVLLGGEEES